MKHIVDFHFVCSMVLHEQINVIHAHATDVDAFTRPLGKTAFDRPLFKPGVVVHCLP